jgi:hypothetical protein
LTSIEENPQSSMKKGADYWRYDIGLNVFPADTQNKDPRGIDWKQYEDRPITEEEHNNFDFSKGLAIIPGTVWHRPDRIGLKLVTRILTNKEA